MPMIYDFEVEIDTPVWEMYLDDSEKQMPKGPDVELEATPKIGDVFLDAEVMLPRGGSLARGRVVKRKRDQEGNPTGRAHENPILDT